MKFAVLYGSVRSARQGIKAARFVVRKLEERGHEATLIDPLDDEGQAPEAMERLARLYRAVDGFVVVSGEYNHGVPPALKNLIDHFQREYFWKPAGIACYSAGPFGGVRAAMQLRAILPEVGLVTIPSIFAMSCVAKSFADDGTAMDEAYDRRIGKFLDELTWYAEACAARRERGVPYA